MIDAQELAVAVACPVRDNHSPCQDAGYCYPTVCRHRLKAVTPVNQGEEQEAPDAQLAFDLP